MKIRSGFVSNSSTSSFVCGICGESYEGWDAYPTDPAYNCSVCPNGHIMCNEHLKDVKIEPDMVKGCDCDFDRDKCKYCPICGKETWVEDESQEGNLSSRYCPICQFEDYSEYEMATYLEKTRGVSRDEVFTKIKVINKRRKKLYNSEYITHVCEKFSLTDEIILKEVKDMFGTFAKYSEFLRSK